LISTQEEFDNPSKMTYYYMEKCKYCKEFNPVWDDFVKKYKGNLVLKKISNTDAGNDLDKYDIQSFPTVVLSNDKGEFKKFEGDRTVDGLMKFADGK
jgi:thiol-disulfide isomerase/thioredoxin